MKFEPETTTTLEPWQYKPDQKFLPTRFKCRMNSCSYYDEYFVAKEFDGNGTECFDMVKEELDNMWIRLEKQGAFDIWPTWEYDACKKEMCDMYMTMYNK
jgi:hypothetical protein